MARQEAKITRQALEQLLRQYIEAHAGGDRARLGGDLRLLRDFLVTEAARHGITPEALEAALLQARHGH